MKTESKVCGKFTSSIRESRIDECDMVIAFGISEEDDGTKIQLQRVGGGVDTTKTMMLLGDSIARIIESIAVDRIHAIFLQKLICAAIRDGMKESSDEKDFIKKLFEAKIK